MLPYIMMLFTTLFWAGAFVSAKLSVVAVPPEIVAFFRFAVGGAILMLLLVRLSPQELRLRRADLPLLLALGLTGVAAYNLLFFWGVKLANATDGALIIPTLNPIATLFLAAAFLSEPLTKRKLAGAATCIAGQALIFYGVIAGAQTSPDRLLGAGLFLGAALCWSAYSVLGRVAVRRFSSLGANAWAMVLGTGMLLPFALWRAPSLEWGALTLGFWGHIAYMGIGATALAFWLFYQVVQQLGASRASIFMNMVPVFTILLAASILGERAEPVQLAGMVVVLGGILVANDAGPSPSANR